MEKIKGGVTAAKGYEAAAAAAGIKYKDRTDMAMIYSQIPCIAAGTFTTNVVKAAPVRWDQQGDGEGGGRCAEYFRKRRPDRFYRRDRKTASDGEGGGRDYGDGTEEERLS